MRLREHPAIGEGRTDILPADPRKLSVMEGYNVRDLSTPEARAELDELKALVKQHGVRTPLVIRFDGEKLWIVEGHRRHKVALELIAEHKASKGAKGRNIDFVPITAEKLGTSDVDRDFGLETSNSGTKLKPLELANLIYRLHTQRGLPLEAVAEGLGKSLIVVKNHLAMRALPEPVKDQVREGDISATEAAKLVKQLPAGTDPNEAAKIIAANKEENKRLGVGKKTSHKVTAKTLRRDRPKAEPKKAAPAVAAPEPETPAPLASGLPATPETTGAPVTGATSLDELKEQIEGVTGTKPEGFLGDELHGDGSGAALPPTENEGARSAITGMITWPRPINRVEKLLLGFLNADAPALAIQYATLCRELEATKVESGEAMQGQEQLCVAADVIGELRFPDDWEGAKANTELDQVA